MERLTKSGFNFTTDFIKRDIDSWSIAQALDKLQKYEDTGISPDQFQVINEEYQKMAKELAELRQQNRWVPVSKRLPEPGIYLVTCDDKDYPVKRMRMKGICFYDHNGIYDGKVLAWMPLPEPYKE